MNKSTTEANPYMFNQKAGVDGSMYIVEEKSPKISSKKDLASERVNFSFRPKQIGSEQQIYQYYGECYFQFAGTQQRLLQKRKYYHHNPSASEHEPKHKPPQDDIFKICDKKPSIEKKHGQPQDVPYLV
jgi:hypothetical protein